MRIFLWITFILSLSLVGCNKQESNQTMKITILETNKEKTNINQNKQNTIEQELKESDKELEDSNEEIIKEIDKENISPFLTYNYLSTTKNTLNNTIQEIENYKDWLSFKNKNVEFYSLFTESPLQIDEDYFSKNMLLIIGNKNFGLDKLITLKNIDKNNNILYFYITKNMNIKEIDNYDYIIENISNFEEIILNQYLLLSFNKKDLKDFSSFKIIQE